MPEEKKSFWATIPGIITAIAGLVTATAALLTILNKAGFFGSGEPSKPAELSAGSTSSQQQLERLDAADRKLREMELDDRIKEMERKIAARQTQPQGSDQSASGTTSPGASKGPFQQTAHLEGTWYFANGAYWTFSQNGVTTTMREYSNILGYPYRTAYGQGTIITNKVYLDFVNYLDLSGKAELTISGNTLSGTLTDNFGNTSSVYLTRADSDINE
jgi:hypothetical protein